MYVKNLVALSAAVASTAAAPYSIPTTDGFPNPSPAQLALIEKIAGGTLPNGPLPTSLKPAGITTLQFLALNEEFEVAYFADLLYNVTHHVAGYKAKDIAPLDRGYVISSLEAVIEQEKLHAIGINGILVSGGQKPIEPCKYQFPVQDFLSAITLAQTFADVVLGTLPVAQAGFAADGGDESGIVPLLGSVIGQEGEQNGFYRFVQKKKPSAAPFLTRGAASFAFTAIQSFIVPDTCPTPLKDINLQTFGALSVLTAPEPHNMVLEFEAAGPVDCKADSVVYLSGQNVPVTVPIKSEPVNKGGKYVFSAEFPFADGFADGLTIAAVVKGTGNFTDNDAVAAATLFGPGLIEVL